MPKKAPGQPQKIFIQGDLDYDTIKTKFCQLILDVHDASSLLPHNPEKAKKMLLEAKDRAGIVL